MDRICLLIAFAVISSCSKKGAQSENQITNTNVNAAIGSTIENINNSQHSVIQFQVDNKECFATINQYFKNYPDKKSFPYSLWITIQTLEKNEVGHPTDAEATLFNNLEDALITKFAGKTPFCFIGRTTRDGYREIMIYVSDKEKSMSLMNDFIKENTFKRNMEFSIDKDENWGNVEGLYPEN